MFNLYGCKSPFCNIAALPRGQCTVMLKWWEASQHYTKNKVTPAARVPLFLAVFPGVPRVLSNILTALCVFSLCAHVRFYM